MKLTREKLYHRHHLSHQQIDELLGEQESGNFPELKGQILAKLHDFLAISKIFYEAKINFIPIKGPLLSYRLYKDPSFRNYGDLDFLMDLPSVKKGILVLKEAGYTSSLFDWLANKHQKDLLFKHYYHIVLSHPERNITIELHWKLNNYDISEAGILDKVINSNQMQIKYAGHNYHVFNNEFELLYLIIHGGLHAWQWLKWLVDIHDFLNNISFDKSKFNELVELLHAERMVALCNALLTEYFPNSKTLPQSTKVSSYLLNYSRNQLQNENDGDYTLLGRIKSYWFRMKCFPGIKYKLSVVNHLFFSPEKLNSDRFLANPVFYYPASIAKKIKRGL